MNNINGKTPEEIIAGLECSIGIGCNNKHRCNECCRSNAYSAKEMLYDKPIRDAIDFIRRATDEKA